MSLQLPGYLQHRYSLSSGNVAVSLSRLLEMNIDKSVTSRGRLEAREFLFMAHLILSLHWVFRYERLVSGG